MCLFLWKNNILRCWGLTFCSKLDWGCYIISIAKTASKKIGALIRSMKFLSHEVALYLYKSIIQPCRTVGPSLAASLEPLGHRRNLVFSTGITLVDVHQNCLSWFHLLILKGGLLVILKVCMIFLLPFLQGCLCQQFLYSHS